MYAVNNDLIKGSTMNYSHYNTYNEKETETLLQGCPFVQKAKEWTMSIIYSSFYELAGTCLLSYPKGSKTATFKASRTSERAVGCTEELQSLMSPISLVTKSQNLKIGGSGNPGRQILCELHSK